MDLKKLRPTKSIFAPPRLSVGDAHQRCRQPEAPKQGVLPSPPQGKGSELWWQYYHDALLRGHEDPEKLADSALRSRENALAIAAKRPTVKLTTHVPKPAETVVATKAKTKLVLHDALRCKATTLEGRRCGFKATCGNFCKKHAV